MLKPDTMVGIVAIVLIAALVNKYVVRSVWPMTAPAAPTA